MKSPLYLNNNGRKSILFVTSIPDSMFVENFVKLAKYMQYPILVFIMDDMLYRLPPTGDHVHTSSLNTHPTVFSKLKYACEIFPDYTHYSWLNPGSIQRDVNIPCCVDASLLIDKIIVHQVPGLIFHQIFVIPRELISEVLMILDSDIENELSSFSSLTDSRPDLFYLVECDGEFHSLFGKYFNRSLAYNSWTCRDRYQIHDMLLTYKGTYAEIGVFKGEYSRYLLNNTPCSRLLLIDPYVNYGDYDKGSNSMDMEQVYDNAMFNVHVYTDRYTFVRKTSLEAALEVEDESLDFIYIDGNHAYDYVYQDLEAWWPKLKKGGYLVCDECYNYPLLADGKNSRIEWGVDNCFRVYGVYQASKDFSQKYKIHPTYFSSQVCFKKEEKIMFVSAFKDIGRDSWNAFKQSTDEYLRRFDLLSSNLSYPMVIYVEDSMRHLVKMRPGLIIMSLEGVNTFLKEYESIETAIITSSEYQSLIPLRRKSNPEHLYASYNLINHSKVNFVQNTSRLFSEFDHYIWINFGCIYNVANVPLRIDTKKLPRRVMYHGLDPLPKREVDPLEMLRTDNVYIMGSMFAVHRDWIDRYVRVYRQELERWHSLNVSDDEQNMVYQLVTKYPDMFEVVKGREWFTLFKDYLNEKTGLK